MRELISERDKMLDIEATVKIAADDGVVTYEEIRESLRRLYNFTSFLYILECLKTIRNRTNTKFNYCYCFHVRFQIFK